MIKLLVFLIAVFALGLGFSWLADRPGTMTMAFEGQQYEVSLLFAAVAIVSIVATMLILWWVLKSLWNSPRSLSRYFRSRKRDRGYQSLSTGIIAAGAGDAALARRMNKQAAQNLKRDQEPMIHLLEAQTLLLEGNHEAARKKFESMIDDPETKVLGLRGLYLEAQRLREGEAARHYAEKAAQVAPHLQWASNATLETRVLDGNWSAALKIVSQQATTGQISKEDSNRRRAVLLTAQAVDTLDSDPKNSKDAAVQANKLAPDLVPGAVTAAKALVRLNDVNKAAKILEKTWKKIPHPEIGDLYVHLRSGDSAIERLKRAKRLQSFISDDPVSSMVVARAAFEAQEFTQAREAISAVLEEAPSEGAYLLLADIEDGETGDEGRVRHWLSCALKAPRDAVWTADGYTSEKWAPFSPVTGKIDAFEWRVPVETLNTPALEGTTSDAMLAIPIMVPEPSVEDAQVETSIETVAVVDPETVEENAPVIDSDEPSSVNPSDDVVAPVVVDSVGEGVKTETLAQGAIHPNPPDDPGPKKVEEPKSGFRLF